ncbi:hypothetical protein VTH82DRAFT_7030 [Thermothelomyces myriococcoides]
MQKRQSTLPHVTTTYQDWAALQGRRESAEPVLVNGRDLTIADVVAVSLHGAAAILFQDPRDVKLVNDSVDFLKRQLEAGNVIYGVNTGFGGSADTRTQHLEQLQSAAIQHLNVGILLKTDKTDPEADRKQDNGLLRSHALPNPIVRAAMLIRCNSLMRGHSGVRTSVIESVMKLLTLDMIPVVPLRGSISASGDLSTLSYIAGAVEGNPDIFVRVGSSSSGGGGGNNDGKTKILSAREALGLAKLEPVRLQAKEGLGITNGTAPSCAAACLAIHQANQLLILAQLLTAMGTEALGGAANNYHPFISSVRPHPGQAEVASNILAFLSGSKLCRPLTKGGESSSLSRKGLAQDRYALRTAPQWLGPQLEDLLLATRQVAIELNSTTDNPLIQLVGEEEGEEGQESRIHHGGNFQAHAMTSAMEKTALALQNTGRLLFAQSSELLSQGGSGVGLPPNLSWDDPSRSFTCKGLDVNMAAYAAELATCAHPVSAHVLPAEMANQSVNSMALVAARRALDAAELVALMAATYTYVLCQALDLRCLRLEFGARVPAVVKGVVERCFWGGGGGAGSGENGEVREAKVTEEKVKEGEGEEETIAEVLTAALLERWDRLAHLDLVERCRVAVDDSLGAVLGHLVAECGTSSVDGLREYQVRMAAALEECYSRVWDEFTVRQTTTDYISPASRVVYDFVRKDLKIPLNRGVEDHPPLLLRKAEEARKRASNGCITNGSGREGEDAVYTAEEELAVRGKTIGTMASEIYEALRRGELHDRIMKFGKESGIWGI